MSSYTENEIAKVAVKVIKNSPGICTSDLISCIREEMNPSGEDLKLLPKRTDDKFSQKVRNLKSHNTLSDVTRTEGGKNRAWYPKEEIE